MRRQRELSVILLYFTTIRGICQYVFVQKDAFCCAPTRRYRRRGIPAIILQRILTSPRRHGKMQQKGSIAITEQERLHRAIALSELRGEALIIAAAFDEILK